MFYAIDEVAPEPPTYHRGSTARIENSGDAYYDGSELKLPAAILYLRCQDVWKGSRLIDSWLKYNGLERMTRTSRAFKAPQGVTDDNQYRAVCIHFKRAGDVRWLKQTGAQLFGRKLEEGILAVGTERWYKAHLPYDEGNYQIYRWGNVEIGVPTHNR